jgi:hypothetical protein
MGRSFNFRPELGKWTKLKGSFLGTTFKAHSLGY